MEFSIKIDQATGQRYMAVSTKGRDLLLNFVTNKGTAFSHREREEGISDHSILWLEVDLDLELFKNDGAIAAAAGGYHEAAARPEL